MYKLKLYLCTALGWLIFLSYGFIYVLFMPFLILLYKIKSSPEIFQRSNHIFYRCFIKSLPFVRVELRNIDRLSCLSEHRTIIVANHQSLIDMGFLLGFMNGLYSIAKIEMKKIPFMNLCIKYSGNIWVDRSNILSIKNAMKKAEEYINMGRQLHFFPEGTRSLDGKLQPFRNGAFKLAVRNNCGVLPICLSGTRNFLVKNRLVINLLPIYFTLTVGTRVEIIDDSMNESKKVETLKTLCYKQIEELLAEEP